MEFPTTDNNVKRNYKHKQKTTQNKTEMNHKHVKSADGEILVCIAEDAEKEELEREIRSKYHAFLRTVKKVGVVCCLLACIVLVAFLYSNTWIDIQITVEYGWQNQTRQMMPNSNLTFKGHNGTASNGDVVFGKGAGGDVL